MTREQLRAARALLGWSQDDLAAVSGVSAPTIKRLEPGVGPMVTREDTLEKLRVALEGAGITFPEPTEVGQMGVFYTPQSVIDVMVDLVKPAPSDVPVYDPVAGTGGFLSRMLGSDPAGRALKMLPLRGFAPGTRFMIPKGRLDRVKAGESVVRHFRETRDLTPRQLADLMAFQVPALDPVDDRETMSEDEIRAAEYTQVSNLPALNKLACVLGVNPNVIRSYDYRFRPGEPPADIAPAVARLRERCAEHAARARHEAATARGDDVEKLRFGWSKTI